MGMTGVVIPITATFTPPAVFTMYGANGRCSAQRIRGEPWKLRGVARCVQILQPVVELVIADRHRVVRQAIHGQHHRIARERRGGFSPSGPAPVRTSVWYTNSSGVP